MSMLSRTYVHFETEKKIPNSYLLYTVQYVPPVHQILQKLPYPSTLQ